MIGSSFSHFRVTSKLGEGGMGEVWQAEDTKLGRNVALKVLPEEFAREPERLARFEREARVLASLSHTNIAGIHGLEEADGKRFLVMELIDGETLAERVQRGQMPVEEAVRVALQIAEAVESAHEKGVIHRDLKPANVKITTEGQVKVLDFGLAKALAPEPLSGEGAVQDLSMSPTLTQAMTGMGVLLGTAGYMSPEQARGKPVDRRADIWAFGCILYEMLTGKRLFEGETATDVIGAVVHKEPDLEELSPRVPKRIRKLMERCLQKEASRRLQSIGDARIALQEWLENPEAEPAPGPAAQQSWRRWLPGLTAAAGFLVGGIAVAVLTGGETSPSEPVRRFDVQIADSVLDWSLGSSVVLSPDSKYLAYVEGGGNDSTLFLRPLDQFEGHRVAGGTGSEAAYHPFFSPDGQWLGYVTPSSMKKVSVTGGAPITLCQVDRSRGASWGPDGTIVFAASSDSGLSIVPATGGEPQVLTTLDEAAGEVSHRWPQWLPGGRRVLFTAGTDSADFSSASLVVLDVQSGERTIIHRGGFYGRYVPTGHVLYVNDGTVFALPFDLGKLRATGTQFPVLEGIEADQVHGSAQYDVADTGLLAYLPAVADLRPFSIVRVDQNQRSVNLWQEPGVFGTPRLSPDGDRLALGVLRDGNWDIWVYDLERGVATRITFGPGYDADPVWSPDGRWLAFSSDRTGDFTVFRKRADGSGQAEQLFDPELLASPFPCSWSPDGKWLAVNPTGPGGNDLWVVPVDGEGEAEEWMTTPYAEVFPAFSPNGRWIAYQSDESGRMEVYVGSFPGGGGKWQISDEGGSQAVWARDGRRLYYRTDEGVMVVDVDGSGETFRAGKPRPAITGNYVGGLSGVQAGNYFFPDYDVAPDGSFVLFSGDAMPEGVTTAKLVTGWFSELERLTTATGE
jgi:Tol biopolymer transport system component/predicted Ser/Thr protein kinase